MALADWVRYHVNVYWEKAPDYRTSRTLDWLNDACEARLKKEDRNQDKVGYTALMSPTSIAFDFSDASLSFDLMQPNRAELRLGKRQQIEKFPISLLLTAGLTTTDDGNPRKIPPYVLFGTKNWPGRRAAVCRYERARVFCYSVQPVAGQFKCLLHITAVGDTGLRFGIDVRFATEFEAELLFKWLEPEREPVTVKSDPSVPAGNTFGQV
jgi:hypothetical protein